MGTQATEVQDWESTPAHGAGLVDELLDEVVSQVVEEVTGEMDRMSSSERAELLAQVLRSAGV